jgi:hypothetical protein
MAKSKAGTGPATPPVNSNKPPRSKIDWEAVERDYRTGHFTLRELETKHGVSYAQISRKSTQLGWSKDLREVIKQATDAAVLRESVTEAQKDVTETVLVAAELNKSVILAHRGDLKATRDVAASLLHELGNAALLAEDQDLLAEIMAGDGAEPQDVSRMRAVVSKALSVNTRIASVKQLADAFDKLQVAERRAFGLDEKVQAPERDLRDFATDELRRLRERLRNES